MASDKAGVELTTDRSQCVDPKSVGHFSGIPVARNDHSELTFAVVSKGEEKTLYPIVISYRGSEQSVSPYEGSSHQALFEICKTCEEQERSGGFCFMQRGF